MSVVVLPGARAAGQEDVQARLDAGPQEVEHLGRRGAEADEVVDAVADRELADGDDRPDERERLDDGVDAGAIGQTGIHPRARLVDVATEGRDDAVDDVEHVLVVAERDLDPLDLAGTLDVDAVRAVDHDLVDAGIGQERLDGSEAGDLIQHALDEPHPVGTREAQLVRVDEVLDEVVDDAAELLADLRRVRQVDARSQGVDDLGLEAVADLEERLFACGEPRGERQAALDGHGYPLATRPAGRSGGTWGGVLLWRRGGLPGSLDTLKQRHPFCPPRLRSDSGGSIRRPAEPRPARSPVAPPRAG